MATSNRNHYSQKHSKYAYRSGLENTNAEHIKQALKAPVKYEAFQIIYTIPSRQTRYTPDFVLPNGIIIETKGRFMPADRQKHLLIKAQYPDLDLRFVFTNSREKLYKGSKTSYAQWCTEFGFKYADKYVPDSWLKEAPCSKRMEANKLYLKEKGAASTK